MADPYGLADLLQGRHPSILAREMGVVPGNPSASITLGGDRLSPPPRREPQVGPLPPPSSGERLGAWLASKGMPRSTAEKIGEIAPYTPMGGAFDAGQIMGQGIAERDPLTFGTGAALAIFAGPRARTANLPALRRAEEMIASGRPREDVWNATGWFQGRDGQWRWEIDDSISQIGNRAMDDFMGNGSLGEMRGPIAGNLWHDWLYAAYPGLRRTNVNLIYDATLPYGRATFRPGTESISPSITGATNELAGAWGPRSMLLHEGQHNVQELEGFARGASTMDRSLDGYARELAQGVNERYRQRLDALASQRDWDAYTALDAQRRAEVDEIFEANKRVGGNLGYYRTAGEVEARNVQTRMDMTPAERRARPPWTTQDVPDDQQILRLR